MAELDNLKTTLVPLTELECSNILVGLSEFDGRICEAKSGCFNAYKKINLEMIDKFRKICWQFHAEKQKEKANG